MRAKRNTSAKRYERLTRLNAMSDGLAVDAHVLNVFLAAEAVAAAMVVAAGGLSQREGPGVRAPDEVCDLRQESDIRWPALKTMDGP